MRVYEAAADAFVDEGVTTVFTLMGDGNMFFVADLVQRHGLRAVHTRHENAALAMADAWARTSGEVGICSVTCGPGVTQISTALTAAVRHRTPLVVYAGDVPVRELWNPQTIDPGPVVAATGASFVRMRSVSQLAETIRSAFVIARRDRLPVVLSIPHDVQDTVVPEGWSYRRSVDFLPPIVRRLPPPESVLWAAERIIEANRPVIVAGRGAVEAGAREPLLELGTTTGSLLATTLKAKDLFVGEQFDIGLVGGLASAVARRLLAEADLIVAVGASMGHFTTAGGTLFPQAEVLQIDVNPTGLVEGRRAADMYLQGDALLAVSSVNEYFASNQVRRAGFRTEEVAEQIREQRREDAVIDPEPGTLDPADVMERLNSVLPADVLVVCGTSHFWNFAMMALHRKHPRDFLFAQGFGAVGHAFPAAIGAAVAANRPVLLVEGDGSMMFHLGELQTVVNERLPLMIIAMNDGGFGSDFNKLRLHGVNAEIARFGRVRLAEVAASFGLSGHHLNSLDELDEQVRRWSTASDQVLVDVPMSTRALAVPTQRMYSAAGVSWQSGSHPQGTQR